MDDRNQFRMDYRSNRRINKIKDWKYQSLLSLSMLPMKDLLSRLLIYWCLQMSCRTGEYPSLGKWCITMRTSYKKIHKNERSRNKLTQENIRQLEDAGFKWSLTTHRTFDERYAELMKFKEKVGHCNVPQTSGEYQSLEKWCNDLRTTYKKIQNNETPLRKLTQENFQQLEDARFNWSLRSQST